MDSTAEHSSPKRHPTHSSGKKVKKKQIKPSEEEMVGLLEHECDWKLMNSPPLTTITVFEEASPGSFNLNSLYDRVALITKQNPWLTGRLRLMPQGIQLYYTKNFINCFQTSTITTKFTYNLSYDTILTLIQPYCIEMGKACIDTNKPLFLITLLQYTSPDTHRKQLILIFSLSPILGDIHTFYQLYEMLDTDNDIITLNIQRMDNYIINVKHLLGRNEYNYIHENNTYSTSMKQFLLSNILKWKLPKPQIFTIYFNIENWLIKQKEFYSQSISQYPISSYPSYLSTNDILTSWFFTLCECDYGLMSINFRNRISKLDNKMAGNYTEKIIYRPIDYYHPSLIRLSLGSYRRCGNKHSSSLTNSVSHIHTHTTPSSSNPNSNPDPSGNLKKSSPSFFTFSTNFSSNLPSLWTQLQNNSCECQNWCQPYRNICLPGVLQILHLPMILGYEESTNIKDTLLIFHPTYGTIGGLIISYSLKIQTIFNNLYTKYENNKWRNSDHSNNNKDGSNEHINDLDASNDCNNIKKWYNLSENEMMIPIRNFILRGRSKYYHDSETAPSPSNDNTKKKTVTSNTTGSGSSSHNIQIRSHTSEGTSFPTKPSSWK